MMHTVELASNCCRSKKLGIQIQESGLVYVFCGKCTKPTAILLLAEDADEWEREPDQGEAG